MICMKSIQLFFKCYMVYDRYLDLKKNIHFKWTQRMQKRRKFQTLEFSISEKYFSNAPANGTVFRQFYI